MNSALGRFHSSLAERDRQNREIWPNPGRIWWGRNRPNSGYPCPISGQLEPRSANSDKKSTKCGPSSTVLGPKLATHSDEKCAQKSGHTLGRESPTTHTHICPPNTCGDHSWSAIDPHRPSLTTCRPTSTSMWTGHFARPGWGSTSMWSEIRPLKRMGPKSAEVRPETTTLVRVWPHRPNLARKYCPTFGQIWATRGGGTTTMWRWASNASARVADPESGLACQMWIISERYAALALSAL